MNKTRKLNTVDNKGNKITVYEYTKMIDTTLMNDPVRTYSPGSKELKLSNGDPVNYINETTFETLDGVTLKVI